MMDPQTEQSAAQPADKLGRDPQLGYLLIRTSVFVVGGLFVVSMVASTIIVLIGGESAVVATMLSAVTGVVGSLVGAYFGVQVGSQGRREAEERAQETQLRANETRDTCEDALRKALAALDPAKAEVVLGVRLTAEQPQPEQTPVEPHSQAHDPPWGANPPGTEL